MKKLSLFSTPALKLKRISLKNDDEVVDVYNSNKDFLESYLGISSVDKMWLKEEIENGKSNGFNLVAILSKKENRIIGIIDFALIKNEAYLSLLMIHQKFQTKGFGKKIFLKFEQCLIKNKIKTIRLDVVKNQKLNVIQNFWKSLGFKKSKNITIAWRNRKLPAIMMTKEI